jgi:hypothetical protein
MIDASPKLIEAYNCCFSQVKTPLSKALAKGNGQTAQELMNSMEKDGVEYTLQERWQITVFKNLDFNDEEFLRLSKEMQSLIYRTANNFNNITLVARLNTLGKYTIDAPITRPSILSLRMDVATTHQILSNYLVKLRQEGRLLTENEFQDFQANDAWFKKDNFTRILGCDYILELTQELNLKHIKVPEKKVVICSNKETLLFGISSYGNQNLVGMNSEDISIYAQEIQKANRFVSREEMAELFTITEAANFSDLWDGNFIVAEDGIYFIDTEIKSFCNLIQWGKMIRLASFMAEEDQAWFTEQIEQKEKVQESTESEYFTDFFTAKANLRTIKKAIERLALMFPEKNITFTGTDPDSIANKQILKQYKLVGSAFPAPHYTKTFSFSVQNLLKK